MASDKDNDKDGDDDDVNSKDVEVAEIDAGEALKMLGSLLNLKDDFDIPSPTIFLIFAMLDFCISKYN